MDEVDPPLGKGRVCPTIRSRNTECIGAEKLRWVAVHTHQELRAQSMKFMRQDPTGDEGRLSPRSQPLERGGEELGGFDGQEE